VVVILQRRFSCIYVIALHKVHIKIAVLFLLFELSTAKVFQSVRWRNLRAVISDFRKRQNHRNQQLYGSFHFSPVRFISVALYFTLCICATVSAGYNGGDAWSVAYSQMRHLRLAESPNWRLIRRQLNSTERHLWPGPIIVTSVQTSSLSAIFLCRFPCFGFSSPAIIHGFSSYCYFVVRHF